MQLLIHPRIEVKSQSVLVKGSQIVLWADKLGMFFFYILVLPVYIDEVLTISTGELFVLLARSGLSSGHIIVWYVLLKC